MALKAKEKSSPADRNKNEAPDMLVKLRPCTDSKVYCTCVMVIPAPPSTAEEMEVSRLQESKLLIEKFGAEPSEENCKAARILIDAGLSWLKYVDSFDVMHHDFSVKLLKEPEEYARRYVLLRDATPTYFHEKLTMLKVAIQDPQTAIANYNQLKEAGCEDYITEGNRDWVASHILQPPEEFKYFAEAFAEAKSNSMTAAKELEIYKNLIKEHEIRHFYRYLTTVLDEDKIPQEKITAYYKAVPLVRMRAIVRTGEIRGHIDNAVWATTDIGLAERYSSGDVAPALMAEDWASVYKRGPNIIVEFKKEAIEKDFKVGPGQSGRTLVNEADIRGKDGGRDAIPFTSEYISRVIAYENTSFIEFSKALEGKGIEVILMSREVAEQYHSRDTYLQRGSTYDESRQLANVQEMIYKDNPRKAVRICRRILRRNPLCQEAYLDMAQAFKDMGRKSAAVNACYSALEINPRKQHAYWLLSRVLFESFEFSDHSYYSSKAASDLSHSLRKRAVGEKKVSSVYNGYVDDSINFCKDATKTRQGMTKEEIARAAFTKEEIARAAFRSRYNLPYELNELSSITDPELVRKLKLAYQDARERSKEDPNAIAAIDAAEYCVETMREGSIDEVALLFPNYFKPVYALAQALENGDANKVRRMFPRDNAEELIALWQENKEQDGVAAAMSYLHAYPLRVVPWFAWLQAIKKGV